MSIPPLIVLVTSPAAPYAPPLKNPKSPSFLNPSTGFVKTP
jgi:hypothetical protein